MPLTMETNASGIRPRAALLKHEVVKGAQENKHQTTTFSDPLCLQAKACQMQKEDTAILKESIRYNT